MKLLVTGGAGFIGSAVVRRAIAEGHAVVNVDKLTYAANLDNLKPVADHPEHVFEQADICDLAALGRIFADHTPDAVMHLAAETHVDRSIDGPADFISTNLVGTYQLLDAARAYYEGLTGEARARFRFHHVSTDEVYGSLGADGAFTEQTPYAPNSPYSASKAGSDFLARAWNKTFGLPVVMSNCSNNYGPCQFPEKFLPVVVLAALEGRPIPIYGTGANIRDWLYVDDHADALLTIIERGRIGESYNVGGDAERTNLELATLICAIMDDLRADAPHVPHKGLMHFVADRPGHDFRYAIDASKIKRELGWAPSVSIEEGLRKTVEWYLDNEAWWRAIAQRGHDASARLGLADSDVASDQTSG